MNEDPASDPEVQHSIVSKAPAGKWVDIRDTVASAYMAIAEDAPIFAIVTIIAACIKFGVEFAGVFLAGSVAQPGLFFLVPYVPLVSYLIPTSLLYGAAGVRWCRRIADDREAEPLGKKMVLLALCCLVSLVLVHAVSFYVSIFMRHISWPGSDVYYFYMLLHGPVLWALDAALLYLLFPAVAVGLDQPFSQGLRLALRNLPELFAIYFIGLLPWWIVNFLGTRIVRYQYGYESELAVRMVLSVTEFAMVSCGIALAAVAYRRLIGQQKSKESPGVFD